MNDWDGQDPDAPLSEFDDVEIVADEEGKRIRAAGVAKALEQQSELTIKREIAASARFEVEGDDLVDKLKAHSSIFELYDRLIGGKVNRGWGGREDGNLAQCPMPNHADKDPSTSFNQDGLWKCFSCEGAGDAIDLYAIAQGFSVPGYRNNKDEFRECIENACAIEGIEFDTGGGFDEEDDLDFDEINAEAIAAAKEAQQNPSTKEDDVAERQHDEPVAERQRDETRARLDLNPACGPLAAEGTFLGDWMAAHSTAMERSPYEYHFFCGLVALGLVLGRHLCLDDPQGDVYGNLGVVLYGDTGARKSAALKNLSELMAFAAPHDEDDLNCTGVRELDRPASGEALIDAMRRVDKSGNDQDDGEPVRGFLALDELEGFMNLMNRPGSTLQDAVMQFLDGKNVVSVTSKGSGRNRVEEGILSFITATQPRAVQGFLGQGAVDNGLLNRFMFVYGEPSARNIDATKVSVGASAQRLKGIQGWAEKTEKVQVERDVRQMLVDVAEDVIDPVLEREQNHLLNRIELHHKRLAFLFAANDMSMKLLPHHVDMATHLIESFVVPTFTAADADLERRTLSEMMDSIKDYVADRYREKEIDKLTRGRIRNSVRVCRKNPDIVDRAFRLLLEEEEIAETKIRALGGRQRILPFDEYIKMAHAQREKS